MSQIPCIRSMPICEFFWERVSYPCMVIERRSVVEPEVQKQARVGYWADLCCPICCYCPVSMTWTQTWTWTLLQLENREGGVVSSCLPHFLPSTPALIGNLGGPVYLHGRNAARLYLYFHGAFSAVLHYIAFP